MNIIKNEFLEVTLQPKGAEIVKMVGQDDQLNYMWKRDPKQWGSSAPILFPIVGKVLNNTYRIDDKEYSMTQHGFARHNEFTIVHHDQTSISYQLQSNEAIAKQYPYLFTLTVTYTLDKNTLICTCKVDNIDTKPILFQIGGHPAFACPFMENESSNDYYLEFEKDETIYQKYLNIEVGAMTRDKEVFLENEKRFFIRQQLFNNDAIVLQDFKSNYVSLKSLNHHKSIKFYMEGFDHLGIWAAKHVGDLIAIEPWVGHIDYIDFTGEFKDKQSVVTLDQNQSFECTFKVEINQ